MKAKRYESADKVAQGTGREQKGFDDAAARKGGKRPRDSRRQPESNKS